MTSLRMVRRPDLCIKCAECGQGYPGPREDEDPERILGPLQEMRPEDTGDQPSYSYTLPSGCTGCFLWLVDTITLEMFLRPGTDPFWFLPYASACFLPENQTYAMQIGGWTRSLETDTSS